MSETKYKHEGSIFTCRGGYCEVMRCLMCLLLGMAIGALIAKLGCSKPAPKLPASATVKVANAQGHCDEKGHCGPNSSQFVFIQAPKDLTPSIAYTFDPKEICVGATVADVIYLKPCPPLPAPRKKVEKWGGVHVYSNFGRNDDLDGWVKEAEPGNVGDCMLVDGKSAPCPPVCPPNTRPSGDKYLLVPDIPTGYALFCADHENCRLVKR